MLGKPRDPDDYGPTPEQQRLINIGYQRGVDAVLKVLREQGFPDAAIVVEQALKPQRK